VVHDLLAGIAADLTAARVRFSVVGGHAASARTETRFTRGIDLAVAVADDREAESLVGQLVRAVTTSWPWSNRRRRPAGHWAAGTPSSGALG
jgi:hypothetical protein